MEREKIYSALFKPNEMTHFPLKYDEESVLIRSYFKNGNSSNLIDLKWDASTFDLMNVLLNLLIKRFHLYIHDYLSQFFIAVNFLRAKFA